MDFPKSVPGVGLVGGVFVDENPATGQPGSLMAAAWCNQVTKEIMAVIEAAAIAPSEEKSNQLVEAIQRLIAESTADTGGMPRFTPYVWGGRGDAMPEGDTQSSGQQLLDFQHPTMRADVLATQFHCTEEEWQANPMKRLTHWSTGDLVSWMRPPDKNLVQPGSVEGGFYGTGVGSNSPLLGTAVLDTLQGHAHEVHASMSVVTNTSNGQVPMNIGALVRTNMVAKAIISDGVNGNPRVSAITKPRTWYGIWMIRMYGRITSAGDLNAAALNARMDMIDARTAALEGRHKALGDGQARINVKANRAANTVYTVPPGQSIKLNLCVIQGGGGTGELRINGVALQKINSYNSVNSVYNFSEVLFPGETYEYAITAGVQTIDTWMEGRAA